MEVPRKYDGLRTVALLQRLVAWIVLAIAVVLGLWALLFGGGFWAGLNVAGRNFTGLLLLIFGVYTFVQLFVVGSVLSLLADLEHSARANAEAVERLVRLTSDRLDTGTKIAGRTEPLLPPPAGSTEVKSTSG